MSSDDDDLNNELLQVAGGRTSGGKRGRAAASVSDSPSDEVLDDSEDDWDSGARGKGSGRKPSAKKRRAAAESSGGEDEDDGEEDDLEAFDDGYASDLMGDAEDRARLAAMSELDRELELAERGEKRDDMLERRKLLQKQRQAERKQKPAARKARPAARTSTRAKKPDNHAKVSAMEELKAARARKAQPRRERQDQDWEGESPDVSGDEGAGGRRRGPPSASASDEEAAALERSPAAAGSDEDEADEDDQRRDREDDDALEEAAFEDINAICVRRHKLEAWVSKPFLERTLPGCLLRLSLGERTSSRGVTQKLYMLAQVVDVEAQSAPRVRDASGRGWDNPYLFGPKKARTNKWVHVRRGDSVRLMPLLLVSNSGPTEEEWDGWRKEEEKSGRTQLTNQDVALAKKRLIEAETYKFTAEDVQRMVEEKRQRGARNTAGERARLAREMAYAREQGDLEEAARLQEVLAALEARARMDAERNSRNSMAAINLRNKGVNFQNAFKDVSAMPEGTVLDADGNDPFSRRKTESRNYWATRRKGAGDDAASTDLESQPAPAAAAAAPDTADQEPDTPAARAHKDEETGLVALDIDLSVLSLPRAPPLAARLLGPDWRASLSVHAVPPDVGRRRTISLAEYRQRQGVA